MRGHRLVMLRLVLCGLFSTTAALLLFLSPPGSQGYVTLPVDHLSGVDRYSALMTQARTATAYHASLEDRRVDIGGYRLHLVCAGHGSPTVVLEAGWPAGGDAWAGVAPTIALQTRVCVYDRAGEGTSDVGPSPRTPLHMVHELHLLMTRAHVPGPYVLVGHSFGGLLVRLFAVTYPHDVAGLVLVDSSVFDLKGYCPTPFPLGRERVEGCTADVRRSGFQPGLLGHKPVVVLAAGMEPSQAAAELWQGLQHRFTTLSTRHLFVVVAQSDHWINLRRPAYVIAAIAHTIDAVRADSPAT